MNWKKLIKAGLLSILAMSTIIAVISLIKLIALSQYATIISISIMVLAVFTLLTHFIYTELEDKDG